MSQENLLDEVITYAERYLSQTGIENGLTPDAIEFDTRGESKVDYVSRNNTLVFHDVDPMENLAMDEDTVKLLGRIYSGLENELHFDSENYNSFRVVLDSLPEDWEVPFDSFDLKGNEEMRLLSSLWREKGDRIEGVVNELRDQTAELKEEYDEVVEPVDKLSRMVSPDEDAPIGIITDYMNSDVKTDVIDLLLAGEEQALSSMEKNKQKIYQRASSNGYSDDEVDKVINETRQALSEIRTKVEKLDEAEEYFIKALEWEIDEMLEQERPEPFEIATAYLLEPLVNGSLEEPAMRGQIEEYIAKLEEEEGLETRKAAEKIFRKYKNKSRDSPANDRFKQAVNEVREQYYEEEFL